MLLSKAIRFYLAQKFVIVLHEAVKLLGVLQRLDDPLEAPNAFLGHKAAQAGDIRTQLRPAIGFRLPFSQATGAH